MNGFDPAILVTALLAGLLGSGHCFGMCGGIAGSLGALSGASNRGLAVPALQFNLGRLLGYAVLHERPRPLQWVAVALAGAGVVWLALGAGHRWPARQGDQQQAQLDHRQLPHGASMVQRTAAQGRSALAAVGPLTMAEWP